MKADPLDRLLAAARRCPPPPLPTRAPRGLERRVLAAWAGPKASEVWAPWVHILRRALAASMILAVASLFLYLSQPKGQAQNEFTMSEAMLQRHLWP